MTALSRSARALKSAGSNAVASAAEATRCAFGSPGSNAATTAARRSSTACSDARAASVRMCRLLSRCAVK